MKIVLFLHSSVLVPFLEKKSQDLPRFEVKSVRNPKKRVNNASL
jgi:hypothetical protein